MSLKLGSYFNHISTNINSISCNLIVSRELLLQDYNFIEFQNFNFVAASCCIGISSVEKSLKECVKFAL